MNFRYDINGLRAIAVIAVVLFHFNPIWLPGGFAGVDVFFVISGFLMTSIIFRGLENDNFNLFKFYVARANRIIPALAVLCLVLLVFGWFYLAPQDYKALGKHVASSMGFISNVIYWQEVGYFDAASYKKWLLHTWSLSVEWQFYIIYPIALIVLKRLFSLKNLRRLIVIGTVIGFGFSIVATMKWPSTAYYLLPTRAWEMMMGGVAFLYPWSFLENKKKVLEVFGLLLILISYFFVSSDIPWPGHFALIPVLGSYLIIVANQQSSVITNNKIFQNLGKCSYSIYLWHWPIYVLYKDIGGSVYIYIILSFILGVCSSLLIERKSTYHKSKIALVTCLIGFTVISYKFDTQGLFVPDEIMRIQSYPNEVEYTWGDYTKRSEKIFETRKPKILIIGDSQAGDLLNMLVDAGVDDSYEIVTRKTTTYCSLLAIKNEEIENFTKRNQFIPKKVKTEDCLSQINKIWSDGVIEQADYIFIAMHIRGPSLTYLEYGIKKITEKSSAEIVVFGRKRIPEGSHKLAYQYYMNPFNSDSLQEYLYQSMGNEFKFNQVINNIAIKSGVRYFSFIDFLCSEGKCAVLHKNKPIYYDGAHTTKYGANFFGGKLAKALGLI